MPRVNNWGWCHARGCLVNKSFRSLSEANAWLVIRSYKSLSEGNGFLVIKSPK